MFKFNLSPKIVQSWLFWTLFIKINSTTFAIFETDLMFFFCYMVYKYFLVQFSVYNIKSSSKNSFFHKLAFFIFCWFFRFTSKKTVFTFFIKRFAALSNVKKCKYFYKTRKMCRNLFFNYYFRLRLLACSSGFIFVKNSTLILLCHKSVIQSTCA